MYDLDPTAARAADQKSAYIQTAGKYKGHIEHVEFIKNAEKGSENIRIVFKTDDGQEAAFFLNMVHHHKERNDGGFKTLSAILACIAERGTGPTEVATIKKWNKDTRLHEDTAVHVFPKLAGKKLGLLIQMEIEKTSQNGRPRPIIYMPFEYATERTASEILAKPPVSTPAVLAKAVQRIAEVPLVDRRPAHPAASAYANAHSGAAAAADDFDDDIPF